MRSSEEKGELFKAMAKFQGLVTNPTKNKVNPHFRSDYADLAAVIATVQLHAPECGLAFVQFPSMENGNVQVETIITHESGQWMSEALSCPLAKMGAQQVGATITYLRRYALAGAAGIAQADDDGNEAQSASNQAKTQNAPKPKEYTDEQFNSFLPAWGEKIKGGTSSGELIKIIQNKAGIVFTPQQVRKLQEFEQ